MADDKKPAAKDDSERDVASEAIKRFDLSVSADLENRKRAQDDLLCLDGEGLWDAKVRKEREEDGRPCLNFNRLPQFVDRVVGSQRQNRPAIKVRPVEGKATGQKVKNITGNQDYELSEVYEGLIRNIEYVSRAHNAYDTAFEHASGTGTGYFRIVNEYADDAVFEQELKIRRIRNQFSVYDDPRAKELDKSDRDFALITDTISRAEFEKKYPDKVSSPFSGSAEGDIAAAWFGDDDIRIAEYFRRVPIKKKIVQLSDGRVVEANEDYEKIKDELAVLGITETASREVDTYRVEWRIISGYETLEGPIDLKIKHIPLVFVPGKELYVNGNVIYRSVIRNSKDAMRAYSYSRTAEIERVALSPKAPYVAGISQVEGLEEIWKTANTKNHGFLPYDDRKNTNPPRRELPPQVSTGDAQQSASAAEDIKATAGIYDAALGNRSNETSGKAIIARKQESDIGTFAYVDNLSTAIAYAGRILIEWIPIIYDTQRVLRLRWHDDSEDFVEINQTIRDKQTGEMVTINDLSAGKFDVTVETGPSYTTQRVEAAESMLQFAQAVPGAAAVTSDLIAKNMDWPGADEFAERLKKTLPPGMVDPEDDEEPPPPQPPSPEQEVAMAQAQADMETAKANMALAEAKKAEAEVRMYEAHAAMQKPPEVDQQGIDRNQVRELVAEAIAEFMAQQQGATQ